MAGSVGRDAAEKVLGVEAPDAKAKVGVAPPPKEQPPLALGSSTLHHVTYALASAAAFWVLEKRRAA
jgi:hypothetical protein